MITYTCSQCGVQVKLENTSSEEKDYKVCLCQSPITVELEAQVVMGSGAES